jgi:hypothetical protein
MLEDGAKMYKIKRICICNHCGAVDIPYTDLGELCPPRGWGSIANQIHLCPKCYKAYLRFLEEGEEYDEEDT